MGKDRGPAIPTKGVTTWGGIARSMWILLAGDHVRIKQEIPHLRTGEIPLVQRAYRTAASLFGLIVIAFAALISKVEGDWGFKLGYCIGVALCFPIAITAIWLYMRHDEKRRVKEEGE